MNNCITPMRDAFLNKIYSEMQNDKSIVFVTADFGSPVIDSIKLNYPKQFINVGIAEQNLINISSGLALEGYKVFVYAIAPFLTMRCFEQIRINIALLSKIRPMNINLIGVGAGFSYVVSGPSHQCYEDLTLIRLLPNFRLFSPSDQVSAESLFDICIQDTTPKYLRFDAQPLPIIYNYNDTFEYGFKQLKKGKNCCIISTGFMTHTALKIFKKFYTEGINVSIIDIYDLTKFNEYEFNKIINNYNFIITMEEGFRARGGLDSMIFEFKSNYNINCKVLNIGVLSDYFYEIGTREELHEIAGIGVEYIYKKMKFFLSNN